MSKTLKGKRTRCPNGSRKNKKTGMCEPKSGPKERAQGIIQRFMKKTKHARIAHFLNATCKDSGQCIEFGKEIKKIKEFFGNFDLSYVKDDIRRIGSAQNGFVNELKFTHKGYSSYAVLKSSSTNNSDNLMYEYKVGQFLNKMSLLYPCFVETYKLFKYNNLDSFNYFKSHNVIPASVLKTHITPQTYDLVSACKTPTFNSVLIQHLKGARTMYDLVNRQDTALSYDLLTILYQIYFVLDQMKDIFTHYDLHSKNVMLYETPGKYIQYHYHSDKIISFRSTYVAKIIDYGRCYFKDGAYSSTDFRDEICAKKACNTRSSGKCGDNVGFSWLLPPVAYHVDSSSLNKSHDLKLVETVVNQFLYLDPNLVWWIKDIVKEIHADLIYVGGDQYGTPERINCPFKICTVSNMRVRLEAYFDGTPLDAIFDNYYSARTKLGDMHIYSDGRPLQFIENV
jgi:hypothetical protein